MNIEEEMETVLLAEGVDLRGKKTFTGLFGEELVFCNNGKEPLTAGVTTKLTEREHQALIGWSEKLGIPQCKFMRDCIREKLYELQSLMGDFDSEDKYLRMRK